MYGEVEWRYREIFLCWLLCLDCLLLKMEVTLSFDMSGITHPMIWHHILEDVFIPTVLNLGGSGWHHTPASLSPGTEATVPSE